MSARFPGKKFDQFHDGGSFRFEFKKINVAADFPTVAEADASSVIYVGGTAPSVIDNDSSKTNTGFELKIESEAIWDTASASYAELGAQAIWVKDAAGNRAYLVTPADIDLQNKDLKNVAGMRFQTAPAIPTPVTGLMYWNNTDRTLNIVPDASGSIQQVGREVQVLVKNNTGSKLLNGKVAYLNGIDGDILTVALAKADSAATSQATLGFITQDIEVGELGLITLIGKVRDLTTTGCIAGQILYLSPTIAGEFTNVEPGSPYYRITLGNCGKVHASTGYILANINVGGNINDVIKVFNGAVLEDTDVTVVSNGTVITLSLEKKGGGDLSLVYDAKFYVFNSTPAATLILPPGTDTAAILYYVYIPKSTKILTSSTVGFPTAEQFVPVAQVICPSALFAQTKGFYKVHAWTDHMSNTIGQGHLSHINAWTRAQQATYKSGVDYTLTPTIGGGTAAIINLATTAGVILQLHDHSFPALNTGITDDVHVVNDPVAAFKSIQGFVRAQLTQDSKGGSLSGRLYTVVVWGVISEATSDCHYFANLPSGSYATITTALQDGNGYSNDTIPAAYVGVGFLIAAVTMRDSAAGGGTLEVVGIKNLRGTTPGTITGGTGGVAVTEFSDAQFKVFNNADNTKTFGLILTAITTGQRRNIIMPDRDVDLGALLEEVSTDDTLIGNGTLASPLSVVGSSQDPVINFVDFTVSEPTPTAGNRHINTATGISSVTATLVTKDYIYEGDGAAWDETIPQAGYKVYVIDLANFYDYTGSAWKVNTDLLEFSRAYFYDKTKGSSSNSGLNPNVPLVTPQECAVKVVAAGPSALNKFAIIPIGAQQTTAAYTIPPYTTHFGKSSTHEGSITFGEQSSLQILRHSTTTATNNLIASGVTCYVDIAQQVYSGLNGIGIALNNATMHVKTPEIDAYTEGGNQGYQLINGSRLYLTCDELRENISSTVDGTSKVIKSIGRYQVSSTILKHDYTNDSDVRVEAGASYNATLKAGGTAYLTGNVANINGATVSSSGYLNLDNVDWKIKYFTGTTPAAGGTLSKATGVAKSKILTFGFAVDGADGNLVKENNGNLSNSNFNHYGNSAGSIVIRPGASQTNVASRPYKAFIIYIA